jgi:hypothetical protein
MCSSGFKLDPFDQTPIELEAYRNRLRYSECSA